MPARHRPHHRILHCPAVGQPFGQPLCCLSAICADTPWKRILQFFVKVCLFSDFLIAFLGDLEEKTAVLLSRCQVGYMDMWRWIGERVRKKGKLSTSHRYDLLPLLRSSPGGIWRELVVYDFPDCKCSHFFCFCKINVEWNETGLAFSVPTLSLS